MAGVAIENEDIQNYIKNNLKCVLLHFYTVCQLYNELSKIFDVMNVN